MINSEKLNEEGINRVTDAIHHVCDLLNISKIERMFLLKIKKHDLNTFKHSIGVMFYTLLIADGLDYSEEELFEIGIAALLHDVGKCDIDPSLLNKPGKLTEEEFDDIKRHSKLGYWALSQYKGVREAVLVAATQHHEKLNGKGYPYGLRQDEIHPYAKVIAVADIYDALRSDRPYRKAMSKDKAVRILIKSSKEELDEEAVRVLIERM